MLVFNEDTRVKLPATIQLLRLDYDYQSLKDADIDFATKIFINRFKTALEKINDKDFTDEEISSVLTEIDNVIKNNDLGKAFYQWLVNPQEKVKLIDFENIDNNDFAVVDELPYSIVEGTEKGSFRPDVNILINGMPLGFLEVKKPNNEGGIQKEFERMISKRLQKPEYKKYFNLIQFVSFSNNMEYEESNADDAEDVKAGSFYTTPSGNSTNFSFFREDDDKYHVNYSYKDVDEETIKYVTKDCGYNPDVTDSAEFQENLDVMTPCNMFVTSVFDKERFLYFLHYGIMFVDEKVPQKHIMRYPQFFATRAIIERLENGGRNGIIWHTQGSGKTGLSAFSNRIIHDYYSKKDVNTRFFFVVDRLDLLRQAATEFKNRGLNVIICEDKKSFTKELNKPLSTNLASDSIGEICVVNIQKFESEMPESKNDYDAKVQRVFFIDEAHRSYSKNGEFFKNLMTCDVDGVYIALTGTPLLSKKERSNLKFGDYIHKYFYDKSIADGYTLRIKKENIDTIAKTEIKNNLEIEDDNKLGTKEVYESDAYVNCLSEFIEADFINFRLQNQDNTIGGMIVCRTNTQAKKVHEWFKKHSKFTTGLVISDDDPTQTKANKENQINFRESNQPDILIVNFMLTTGYDVKRLKKMYLLRGPHAQTLLQTISRVNRPYKSPNGKTYKYGYIVDFVDIEQEFENTMENYIKELEADFDPEGGGTLTGLVIDKEDINKKYHKLVADFQDLIIIDMASIDLETFSKLITRFDKPSLLKVRKILNGIKECETEFVLSRALDYAKQIDTEKVKKMLRTTQERIDFINLSTNTVQVMDYISDKQVVEIIYNFIKTKIMVIDLSQFIPENNPHYKKFETAIVEVQKEVKANKNKKDIRIIKLDQMLQDIFNRLAISSDLSDIGDIADELLQALAEVRAINEENERLSNIYGGNYSFVKTYQDTVEENAVDRSIVEKALKIIFSVIEDKIDNDAIIVQGRKNFIDSIKHDATKLLLKEKLYAPIKPFYDSMLGELYINIQLLR